ncbi:MAG: TIGR00266 family protein [Bacteroidota bacterium]|nr:TIGR00266 family protein [Bacteroidota bacterium]
MADVIDYKIIGSEMQIVEIELDPSEGVRAEVGAMMYMEESIQMQTGTGGGLFAGFKRMVSGSGFFITTFVNGGYGKSHVAFAAPYPGKIIVLELDQIGGSFLCQKDAFLCAANGIDIEVAFTKKIGAGLFGGEGFILQRLSGNGRAFIHAGGTIIKKELRPNESLRVDTGCLVAFAPTVDYDIQFIGGFKNALFGGEGLFLAKLTGPGTVYLQSLPFSRLADRIMTAATWKNQDESKGIAGIGGGLLGGLFGGDDRF